MSTPSPNPAAGGGGKQKTPPKPKKELGPFTHTVDPSKGLTVVWFCREGDNLLSGRVRFFVDGKAAPNATTIDSQGYAEHTFSPDDLPKTDKVTVRAQLEGSAVTNDETYDISKISSGQKPSTTGEPDYLNVVRIPVGDQGNWRLEIDVRSDGKPVKNYPVRFYGINSIAPTKTDEDGHLTTDEFNVPKDTKLIVKAGRLQLTVPLLGPDPAAATPAVPTTPATTATTATTSTVPTSPTSGTPLSPPKESWWRRYNNYVFLAVTVFLLVLLVGFVLDFGSWLISGPSNIPAAEQGASPGYDLQRELDTLEQEATGKKAPTPPTPSWKDSAADLWMQHPWIRGLSFLILFITSVVLLRNGRRSGSQTLKKWGIWIGLASVAYATMLLNFYLPVLFRLSALLPATILVWLILIPACFYDEARSMFKAAEKRLRHAKPKRDIKSYTTELKVADTGTPTTVLYVDGKEADTTTPSHSEQRSQSLSMSGLFWRVFKADIFAEVIFKLISEAFRRSVRI